MKNFCIDLKEHATKTFNYEKKEMIPLTKEQKIDCDDDNKKYHKVRDHCHYTEKYRGAAHDICDLKYKRPK